MKRLSFYIFFFQKYYKFFGFGMTWGFSRPVTRRSVLAGWLPARPAPSLVHRMAMGLQPASRPARRQAWYIYGPIFWTSRAWLQPPARGDPSLLGLSRAVLTGCRPARRQAFHGWPRVCRARALALRSPAGPPAERGPLVYT